MASSVIVILCSAFAAGLGLAGLARRDMPERRWLVLTVLSAVLVLLAGYGGAFGAPFHGLVQDWLNGGLAPFRNIYKFQPGLALALVLGIAHLVGTAAETRGAREIRGRRYAPLVAAVLILPGLLWPYLNGSILNPGSFQELPKYWHSTADWLEKYSPTRAPSWSPRPRTASTPGARPSTSRSTSSPSPAGRNATTSPSAPPATGGPPTRSSRR